MLSVVSQRVRDMGHMGPYERRKPSRPPHAPTSSAGKKSAIVDTCASKHCIVCQPQWWQLQYRTKAGRRGFLWQMTPVQEVYDLPPAAYNTLADPTVKLELHCIGISHYCERARWALRLLGIPYKEVNFLPLAHIPDGKKLQKLFNQGRGATTASGGSPFVTPVLAIWTHDDKPLCLLQNSALISRYASLRAKALGLKPQYQLYGSELTVDTSATPHRVTGSGTEYEQISELELRAAGTLGVEARRVSYFYLLPSMRLAGRMFYKNSTGWETLFAWPIYLMSRLMLPKLLKINKTTAAKGQQKLLQEFDYFDQILLERQQQTCAQTLKPTPATAAPVGNHEAPGQQLPYYLCGDHLTAADISLACLGGYVVKAPYQHWEPPFDDLPVELKTLIKTLQERPTGKYILELWRQFGPRSELHSEGSP